MHIGHDGIDILGFFLGRISVVHPNVADAVKLVCDPKIQADRLGVTDVKITVRLRRKARDNSGVLAGPQIIRHNIADEVGGGLIGGRDRHRNRAKVQTNAEVDNLCAVCGSVRVVHASRVLVSASRRNDLP